MTQNSWITSGIITSCRRKRELCNKLQNNNNATLTSYYKDYSKILTKVIQMAKRMEYDKLILKSCDKAKTTWDIINKESGRNKKKKRSVIQTLKVQDKKITDQQTIAETFNEYFAAIAENINRQKKSNLINDVDDNRDSHTHFMEKAIINLTQAWNINAPQQEKLNEL